MKIQRFSSLLLTRFPSIAARARLKEKRELEKQAARERRAEPVSDNSTQAENVPEENNELTESQCEGVEEELEMSM